MSKEYAKSCRRLKEWGGQLLGAFPGRWRYLEKIGGWQLGTRIEVGGCRGGGFSWLFDGDFGRVFG